MRVQDKCKNGLGPNHNVVDKEFGNSQTHQSVNWYLIQHTNHGVLQDLLAQKSSKLQIGNQFQ